MSIHQLKIEDNSRVFFGGDHHFTHANILGPTYDDRPFTDIHHMKEELIDRHNAIVGENDVYICIGDFLFGKFYKGERKVEHCSELMDAMNGNLFFIYGNHDSILLHPKIKNQINLFDRLTVKVRDEDSYMKHVCLARTGRKWTSPYQHMLCDHYRMDTFEHSFRGAWNIHGHSHGKLDNTHNQIDVGVMNNDYFPFTYQQIKDYFISQFNKSKNKQ